MYNVLPASTSLCVGEAFPALFSAIFIFRELIKRVTLWNYLCISFSHDYAYSLIVHNGLFIVTECFNL